MIRYLARRFIMSAFLTVLATTLAYVAASSFMDPAKRYLGRNPPTDPASIARELEALGVNPQRPVLERTWIWLTNIFTHGSLNNDFNNQPVTQAMFQRAGTSLKLLLVGTFLAALIGVTLGVWGAVKQYKASDQIVTYASYIFISTPAYVLGILLMIFATWLNNSVFGTQVIRFSGEYTPRITGFWPRLWDGAMHLLLPTITLTLLGASSYSRYQRSIMLDVLGSDYIRTARAKGATRSHALIKHGVRVALIPMSTYFAYSFGTMLTGATFTEIVFSWNGMGQYGINAVTQSDINALVGTVAFAAICILFSSMLSEILYAALDPRVRV